MSNTLEVEFRPALVGALSLVGTAAWAQTAPVLPPPGTFAEQGLDLPGEPAGALKAGKLVHALRLTGPPPDIDGRLTDEVWSDADIATDLVQRDPDNGKPMSERTLIQVAYNDRFLFVAIRCFHRDPAGIAAGLGRRDDFPASDYVTVGFDPRHDHLTAYAFQTNPSGLQGDFFLSDDDNLDRDYNAVWEVRTTTTAEGWTAEFRIPFSQMRFSTSGTASRVWGFQVDRLIRRTNERGTWVGKPRGERGEVSLFGHLVFDDAIEPPRRLEVMPYVMARASNPDDGSTVTNGAVGADLRLGLGSGATLSAAINPDFGQVEQDPAVLNLSVFETFYPEKRAFFLEDSRTFVPPYGLFQLFHSRRIGRPPSYFELDTDDGEDVAKPDETTIIGAAKVTGKSSGWTYGVLTALTGREQAVVTRGAAARQEILEPVTSYNVARIQRDVLHGSNVGAIVTNVVRKGAEDAVTGGFDYNFRWDDNRTELNGHWVGTRAPGDEGVRSDWGGVANLNASRKHWTAWSHVDHFGRDFRVNDLGFFRGRANRNQVDGGFAAEQPDPTRVSRSFGSNIYTGRAWNDAGLVFGRWIGANHWFTFRSYWRVQAGYNRAADTFDDVDTRGGVPIFDPGGWFNYLEVRSDSRKSWRLFLGANRTRDRDGSSGWTLGTNLTLQPTTALQLSAAARYEKGFQVAQWIANEDADGDGIEDHVYGSLRRNVVDLTFRATYSLNRDLTLQAYLQPFVAVGDYDDIRKLARARSFEFTPVTRTEDADFNDKSLRGNIVLRWEYLRGSALFLVWDLSQEDKSRPGRFSGWRDVGDAFGAAASHVVMMKVAYWFNR